MSGGDFYTNQTRVFNLKKKWFALTDTMDILDGNDGKIAFRAVGKFFHLGVDMLIKDESDTTLCELKSEIISLMPEYNIYQNGEKVGEVRKEIGLFGERWAFTDTRRGQKWEVSGDFYNYEWKIHKDSDTAGQVTKERALFDDHYTVSVEAGNDMLQIICVAVCMEKYQNDKSIL